MKLQLLDFWRMNNFCDKTKMLENPTVSYFVDIQTHVFLEVFYDILGYKLSIREKHLSWDQVRNWLLEVFRQCLSPQPITFYLIKIL